MDNAAHLHLLVNHFPVIAPVLAVPMLLLALLLRKERGLLLASVLLLVVAAVSGWLSTQTGEKAQHMIERAQDGGPAWADDVDDKAMTEHEERAEKAMPVAIGAALVGVVVLVLAHRRTAENPLPRPWIALVLLGAAATSAAMGWVANAGGVIMHREIRGDSMDTTKK